MPINRTPPTSPHPLTSVAGTDEPATTLLCFESTLHQCASAPNLSADSNITERKKRKFDGAVSNSSEKINRTMFAAFSNKQESYYEDLMSKMNSIIEQNVELKKSVEMMSEKYDEFLSRITTLEAEKREDRKLIQQLEDKIELLERSTRATGIEIRNVPKTEGETKDDLCGLVMNLGQSLNLDFTQTDLKDVHRFKTKGNSSPIHVNFTSVIAKEKVMNGIKTFNKNKDKSEKLNTTHLKIKHVKQPVYISECLTYKTQKLYYLARTQHKNYGYSFCWTSRGVVYLRKKTGDPQIRVNSEADFEKLRCSNSI
ncbi:unnamed protein product, partial [Brenthis ino]